MKQTLLAVLVLVVVAGGAFGYFKLRETDAAQSYRFVDFDRGNKAIPLP